ncbi:MAG: PadR family transcriptional regulator [Dethiobacter sp.]|nr:PadR family transcriptional regulator [Dethiobacter sp.]
MGLQHLILGCLVEHPTYGYKMLKSIFKDFLGQGPEVNDGQLYSTLKKMENEGLIVRETIHQEVLPSKKLLYITGKGEEAFRDWLLSDENETGRARYDFFNEYRFLYKGNFFNFLEPAEALQKTARQLTEAEQSLSSLLAARGSMVKKKVSAHRIKILDYGLEVQKVRIRWLKEFMALYREENNDESGA